MTHSVEIFIAACKAIAKGVHMKPRSANDKEYFPQDWFADRVGSLGLPSHPQGRNSYPDFWVGGNAQLPYEGYEIKSLAFSNGKPARKDYDSNSTIPSGSKDGRDTFLVFFLYTGAGASPRPVHSLCITHGDLITGNLGCSAARPLVLLNKKPLRDRRALVQRPIKRGQYLSRSAAGAQFDQRLAVNDDPDIVQ